MFRCKWGLNPDTLRHSTPLKVAGVISVLLGQSVSYVWQHKEITLTWFELTPVIFPPHTYNCTFGKVEISPLAPCWAVFFNLRHRYLLPKCSAVQICKWQVPDFSHSCCRKRHGATCCAMSHTLSAAVWTDGTIDGATSEMSSGSVSLQVALPYSA